MQYHSTRGNCTAVDSAQAILTGIAPDGGLYLPKVFPAFAWEKCVASTPLDAACQILSAFFPDIALGVHKVDDRTAGCGVELAGISIAVMQNIPGKFDDRTLHTKANT